MTNSTKLAPIEEAEPICPDPENGRCWCLGCSSYLEAEQAEREHHETTRHRPTFFSGW